MGEHSDIVLTLVRMASEYAKFRLGSTAIHKTLYFFNQKYNKFQFKWGELGPYSGLLQQILCDLQAAGWIRKTYFVKYEEYDFLKCGNNPVKNHYVYVEKRTTPEISKDLCDALREALEFTSAKTISELELLGSVHMLLSSFGVPDGRQAKIKYMGEFISKFTERDLERAMDELETFQFPLYVKQ